MLEQQLNDLTGEVLKPRATSASKVKPQTSRELVEKAAKLIIASAGEDLEREGLVRTPHRFAKAYDHLLSGYNSTPAEVVGNGIFAAEGKGLVVVENVEFFSMCEHHILPFWGSASVAYYPNRNILGLSKIPRLIELFSRRLQVQERLTEQLADALTALIDPRAVAVKIRAQHLCMMMRGVEKQNSSTLTEAFRGTDNLLEIERSRLMDVLNSRS